MSWILENLFRRPGLHFILGTHGSKKTWLALDLAVSVAQGCGWLALAGPAMPVLYLDEDLGPSEFARRLCSVLLARRVDPKIPFHFSSLAQYDFADPADLAQLADLAHSVGAGLIIIDNFARSLPLVKGKGWGWGPSSSFALRPLIANLRRLVASANAAVLVLLHTRQRRTGLAPFLLALGADHVLALDSPYGQSWLHLRTLAADQLAPISLTAEIRIRQPRLGKIVRDPEFLSLSTSSVKPSPPLGKAAFAVLEFLKANGASTSSQLLAKVTAAVPGRLLHVINQLAMDGYLYRIDPGGKGKTAMYAVTPAGLILSDAQCLVK